MKKLLTIAVALAVTLAAFADDVKLTPGVADIVKLCEAKVGATVVVAFVENSPVAYNPGPDEIVYLRKQGVPDEVVAAMLQHGAELRRQSTEAAVTPPSLVPTPQTPAPPAGAQPLPMVEQPATIVEQPVYPYYGYTDYYWPYYWSSGYWGWGVGGWRWIEPGWRYGGYGFHGGYGGFHGGLGAAGHGGGHR